jgi:hypothetical protein
MEQARSRHGTKQISERVSFLKPEEKVHLEDPGVELIAILHRILKKQNGRM